MERMANYIKETERQRYVDWVFRSRLKSLDWKDQCSITEEFMNREKPFIPSDLLAFHPDQLTHDIDDHGLKSGDVGTVVHCYNDKTGFEVEFVTAEGKTIAVLTLTNKDIQPFVRS